MNRSVSTMFQVPAPNHLRPLPGDDGEDSDGKAAQFHLRAVCNGERFSRLHRHQPLHDVLRQQLRQRDRYELSQRLACQNFMYGYSFQHALLLNRDKTQKPFLHLMFICSFVSLTHWTDHLFRWARRRAHWKKGNTFFADIYIATFDWKWTELQAIYAMTFWYM